MTQPRCPQHPDQELTCPACLGRKGGQAKSPAKTRAAKQNILKRWATKRKDKDNG